MVIQLEGSVGKLEIKVKRFCAIPQFVSEARDSFADGTTLPLYYHLVINEKL